MLEDSYGEERRSDPSPRAGNVDVDKTKDGDGSDQKGSAVQGGERRAPFGRYESSDASESPANEFLVGREPQRRRLLNLLFTHGKRGAYLVTGQRGSGKTSFVDYCLGEYQQDVFGRFLKSNVGQSWSDRIGLGVAVCLLGVLAFTLKGVVRFLVYEWHPEPNPYIGIVVAVPLLLAFAYPALAAKELLLLAWDAKKWPLLRALLGVCLVLGCCAAWALFLDRGSSSGSSHPVNDKIEALLKAPAPLVAVLLASTLILGHICALRPRELDPKRGSHGFTWRFGAIVLLLLCLLIGPFFVNEYASSHPWLKATPTVPIVVGLFASILEFVARFFGRPSQLTDWSGKPMEMESSTDFRSMIAGLLERLLPLLADSSQGRMPRFARERMILTIKAVSLVVLSVVLINGAFRRWSADESLQQEVLLLALLIALFISIARLEFNWIIRPHLRTMSGIALDLRRNDDEVGVSETYARRLVNYTFFAFLYRWWLPSFVVRVNLGVEALDHRRVIEAMLGGLRDVYERTFLHWRSPLANAGRAVRMMLLVTATTLAADHFFGSSVPGNQLRVPGDQICGQPRENQPKINELFCLGGGFGRSLASALQFKLIYPNDREPSATPTDTAAPAAPGASAAPTSTTAPATPGTSAAPTGTAAPATPGTSGTPTSAVAPAAPGANAAPTGTVAPVPPGGSPAPAGAAGPSARPDPPLDARTSIAHFILPTSVSEVREAGLIASDSETARQRRQAIDVRLYHVFIFLCLLLAVQLIERRWPVFPYRKTFRDIDEAIASLSSKLTQQRGIDLRLGGETLKISGTHGRETAPLDPRTVELMFLRLLRQIDEAALRLPFVAGARLSVPVPDLFFLFDELDKLGAHGTTTAPPSPGSDEGPVIVNNEERDRSVSLKKLFSDLKNILSSAPARFVFVGGRNLHDEWLADQNSRQPLLTRLFVAEIYIPSLLTDKPKPNGQLSAGVDAFLRAQLLRARARYKQWMGARRLRWLRHTPRDPLSPSFLIDGQLSAAPKLMLQPSKEGSQSSLDTELLSFLTYRSMGNVKRLKELVESFIQQIPRGSAAAPPPDAAATKGAEEGYTHELVLAHTDIHRVQLIADLYRGLLRVFRQGTWQDDKLAPAVFYVADFLLKFHRRAFTWTNLERIDELIHVHRAPELRKVLHAIVEAWTGTLLHPIRNGMFDFRFRIETALELRLASRRSDEEMAALNFTLDEAQDIKDLYRRRLASASDAAAFEFEAALGELHDLDEEYDLARYRYRRAIQRLDEQSANDLIGPQPTKTVDAKEGSMLQRLIMGDPRAITIAQQHPHWAVSRLRLMLQIALTHERTRDFENAALKYRSARSLAEALLQFGLSPATTPQQDALKKDPPEENPLKDNGRNELLKHANLLFQPVFAEAWVGEKEGTLIDGSVVLVERAIAEARKQLPFVNKPLEGRDTAASPTDPGHAAFALTLAELHDKAGDLLFFKGKPAGADSRQRGYLDRAHLHYARSLHELRAYNKYRQESSKSKLAFDKNPTLGERAVAPDFVLQIAAGSLGDLGEALLAGTSLRSTFIPDDLRVQDAREESVVGSRSEDGWTGAIPRMVDAIVEWVEGRSEVNDFEKAWARIFASPSGGDLATWLGEAKAVPAGEDLEFAPEGRGGRAQFIASLLFSLAAARALKRDGRLEDAARESLQVTETIARWLLAERIFSLLERKNGASTEVESNWHALLGWIATYSLERAQLWWRLSRRGSVASPSGSKDAAEGPTEEREEGGRESSSLTPSVVRSLSVAPVAVGNLMPRAVSRLLTLLHETFRLFPEEGEAGTPTGDPRAEVACALRQLMSNSGFDPDGAVDMLDDSLRENAYPMTHQLYGQKILIDLETITMWARTDSTLLEDVERIKVWEKRIETLIRDDSEYDGRHRFTHSDIGVTLGAACVLIGARLREEDADPSWSYLNERLAALRSDAIEHLDRAEESFTLRRSYQAWIGDLYYLHDDFNDRRLHYNRAAEMVASELIAAMLVRLRADAHAGTKDAASHPRLGQP